MAGPNDATCTAMSKSIDLQTWETVHSLWPDNSCQYRFHHECKNKDGAVESMPHNNNLCVFICKSNLLLMKLCKCFAQLMASLHDRQCCFFRLAQYTDHLNQNVYLTTK